MIISGKAFLRRLTLAAALAAAVSLAPGAALTASAPPQQEGGQPLGHHVDIPKQKWTFGGLFGYFDQQQLQRGYKVYKSVCAACHGMKLLAYRNLGEPGGPHFSQPVVRAIAAEAQVSEINDKGEAVTRPGKPADKFVGSYKNNQEAAAANNGAVPPDLSVIAKARGIEREAAWFMVPWNVLKDMATQYQEQGPDYLYALLTGYTQMPKGMEMAPGMNYNAVFPGHQIAMPNPLSDGVVEYEDGAPATVASYSKDVTAFLQWASEPTLEERKKMGLKVMVYLIILCALLYLSKKLAWRSVKH